MSWNYRVMFHRCPEHGDWFGIHEVYYNTDRSISSWTVEHVEPMGDTLDELRDDLAAMTRALEKPVLDYDSPEGWVPESLEDVLQHVKKNVITWEEIQNKGD